MNYMLNWEIIQCSVSYYHVENIVSFAELKINFLRILFHTDEYLRDLVFRVQV